jgi:hypothetical protein
MFPVDLQDPTSILIKMIRIKLTNNVTGVFGRKINREESFLIKNCRNCFYYALSKISTNKINKNVGEFGIVDKWVIDACLSRNDYYPFIRGIISNITSDLIFLDYIWVKRKYGKSKHNYLNLYDHGINAFISSGSHFFRPLVFIGFFVSFLSFVFGITNVILFLYNNSMFPLRGIATLIVTSSFFFGLIFIFLGFIGEYIMSINAQVRGFDNTSFVKDKK